MRRLLTSFHNPSLLDPIFDKHRGGIFYLVVAVFCAVDLLQLVLTQAAIPGMTTPRVIGFAALLLFIAFAAFYRFTKRLQAASIAVLAAAYIAAAFAALKQGGAPAPTLCYMPFLPLCATVLLGRRAGLICLAVSIGVIVFCTWAAISGFATPSPHSAADLRILTSSAGVLLAGGVAVYAAIYENLVITAMRATEEAQLALQAKADELEKNEEFLSAVMEAAHDGVIATDPNGKLSVFNRAARELHGLGAMPLTFEDWPQTYSLYAADGVTPLKPEQVTLYRALQGEKIVNEEMAVCVPGEDIRFILSTASPMYGKNGQVLGALTTLREITREKHQEEKIHRQNSEIDQFARVASVDLQAPLNRIVMTSELMLNTPEVKASARMRNDLASITTAAKKMGALIKDVLYMSRLPIGEISLQPVIARDCIEAAIDLSEISEADCRLDFRFSGSPDVVADPHCLTLVFKNLIENAWKHASTSGKAHVEFTCILERGAAVLGVKDNGKGLSQERVERLFRPLERVRTDDEAQGSGLGLAICRKSVARMGGDFWVESPPGEGCHFRLRLPLAETRTAIAS